MTSPDETRWSYPGWLVVLAAFFGVFAGFGTLVFYTFGLFIKPLTAEFGWNRETVSAAFGASSMSIALFGCATVTAILAATDVVRLFRR